MRSEQQYKPGQPIEYFRGNKWHQGFILRRSTVRGEDYYVAAMPWIDENSEDAYYVSINRIRPISVQP